MPHALLLLYLEQKLIKQQKKSNLYTYSAYLHTLNVPDKEAVAFTTPKLQTVWFMFCSEQSNLTVIQLLIGQEKEQGEFPPMVSHNYHRTEIDLMNSTSPLPVLTQTVWLCSNTDLHNWMEENKDSPSQLSQVLSSQITVYSNGGMKDGRVQTAGVFEQDPVHINTLFLPGLPF